MTTYLTTGHKSGLGRYLHEYFGGIGIDRSTKIDKIEVNRVGADVIIHCASQAPKNVTSNSLYPFIDDNILLTERMTEFRHKKFIFISTVDVYPKNANYHDEDEDIPLSAVANFYAVTKLISESIIKNKCPNFLIIRCTSLLGKYSRQNSLIKMKELKSPKLTLAGSSEMNYVLHQQVADFIKYAVSINLTGVYNAAATDNIKLSYVADLFKKKVNFGSYLYRVGNISNRKISSALPVFAKTSEDVIAQFIKNDFQERKNVKFL